MEEVSKHGNGREGRIGKGHDSYEDNVTSKLTGN